MPPVEPLPLSLKVFSALYALSLLSLFAIAIYAMKKKHGKSLKSLQKNIDLDESLL